MRERTARFGTSTPLVGVLTEPGPAAATDRPAILLLNSGIIHHVGASRLHVQIARRLAASGFIVLRFDLSSIGDSEARKDALAFEESAVQETREAMDYLAAAKGAQRFVLAGLCSGADMSFRVAEVDPRVVGVAQLDAWAYRTWRHYWVHYSPRMLKWSVWGRFFRRRLPRLLSASRDPAASEGSVDYEAPSYRRKFPRRDAVERGLRDLVRRDTRLLYIFSGGQIYDYNHHGQYQSSFRRVPFKGLLREEFVPEADHTFTGLEHQRYVVNTMAEWAEQHWPLPSRVAGTSTLVPGPSPALTAAPVRS